MAGLLMPDAVSAELHRWAREPFDWATANCGLSVLDYVERVTGRLLPNRPVLTGRRSARRYVRAAGGMESLCAAAMQALGCPLVMRTVRGDVGLVDSPGRGLIACIHIGRSDDGRCWAARGDGEVIFLPWTAKRVMSWRVACLRR